MPARVDRPPAAGQRLRSSFVIGRPVAAAATAASAAGAECGGPGRNAGRQPRRSFEEVIITGDEARAETCSRFRLPCSQ